MRAAAATAAGEWPWLPAWGKVGTTTGEKKKISVDENNNERFRVRWPSSYFFFSFFVLRSNHHCLSIPLWQA